MSRESEICCQSERLIWPEREKVSEYVESCIARRYEKKSGYRNVFRVKSEERKIKNHLQMAIISTMNMKAESMGLPRLLDS